MRKHTLVSLLFILIMSEPVSAQLMLKEVSLSEQIEKSSLVIEGKVLSKKSFWDLNHEKIYTVNNIEVYKVFKGEALSTIEIITPGGIVGLDAQIVYPCLKLSIDDTGVFTLNNNYIELDTQHLSNEKQFKPYGSLQGFYKYDFGSDIAVNHFATKKGITSTFYSEIKNHTKSDYIQLSDFNLQNKISASNKTSLLPPTITSFFPTTSSAGIKSVLTINGSNFGAIKGDVGFRNADNAGASFINALDSQVLTWTDTAITVEIPSEAGTGEIRVTHNDGSNFTSNNTLFISYAQANIVSNNVAYQTQLISDNENGGYTWQMTSEFAQNAEAKDASKRALETWSCETQMNWDLNESSFVTSASAMHKSVSDSNNVLAFDDSTSADPDDDLPDTVLGQRTSYYSACTTTVNGVSTLKWYIIEFDIIFDDETNWNFDVRNPSDSEYDFESVVLHELGHCRQLDHIINTDNVMHFAIAKGELLRSLDSNNLELANIIQDKNTNTPVCSQSLLTNYSGNCSLGIKEDELNAGIKLYPNPTKGDLFISNDGTINLEKVVVYDVSGRLITQQDISNTSRLKTISLNNASKGVYFVTIHSDIANITKKVIIN